MIDTLKNKVQHLNRKKIWTTEEIGEYQEYLLTNMKVISKREYNKLSKNDKKETNYLVRGKPMLLI
eukprot:SAG11_NODE_41063_length_198_cov_52.565657_1_plen_65_part_11